MVSPEKIAANRANAQKSTGPKTARGKRAVRLNALKHGLLSNQIEVTTLESAEEFDKLLVRIRGGREPGSDMEALLQVKIAQLTWQSRRLNHIQDVVNAGKGPVSKLSTKLRCEGSLGRQMREAIQQLTLLQTSKGGIHHGRTN